MTVAGFHTNESSLCSPPHSSTFLRGFCFSVCSSCFLFAVILRVSPTDWRPTVHFPIHMILLTFIIASTFIFHSYHFIPFWFSYSLAYFHLISYIEDTLIWIILFSIFFPSLFISSSFQILYMIYGLHCYNAISDTFIFSFRSVRSYKGPLLAWNSIAILEQ